jgi:uncharacterized protein YbjT (DUF2867 family)
VDGAFLLIPFDMKAPDLHKREDEIGMKLAEAVKTAGVRHVVLLSGTTAHLREQSGTCLGAAMMEQRLDGLGIAELVHLHGAFFMENFLNMGIVDQAKIGVFRTMFRGDIATPMVATKEVGEKAAELLTEEPFRQPRVREVLGARDYTMAEATGILGSAIGKPELKYVHPATRQAYADDNVKANEYLYRHVNLEDVANAHLLALEKAPSIGFGRYIISATTPFLPDDLLDLRLNAPLVVRRRVPDYEAEYAHRGWKMFPSIDRVYVNERARKDLGWRPRYDFRYVLDCLRAGADPRSPLARAVGSKGYHAHQFAEGPYPVS